MGKQDVIDELKVLEIYFIGDYDADSLTSELQLLPPIFEFEPISLEDVVEVLKYCHEKNACWSGIMF